MWFSHLVIGFHVDYVIDYVIDFNVNLVLILVLISVSISVSILTHSGIDFGIAHLLLPICVAL